MSLLTRALALREHGQRRKYEHEAEGFTARLDTVQAIVLLRKLPLLRPLERREAEGGPLSRSAGRGRRSSPSSGCRGQRARLAPLRRSDGRPGPARGAPHRTRRPNRAATIRSRFISTGAYAYLGSAEGSFPVAEDLARQCLSLPIFPGMREDEVEHVVAAVKAFFDDG